jgi:hypothetical protein
VLVSPKDNGRIWDTAVDTCTKAKSCATTLVKGNNPSNSGAAVDMQGVVIKQVSGPALRGKAANLPPERR